jgi:hypothetical protein
LVFPRTLTIHLLEVRHWNWSSRLQGMRVRGHQGHVICHSNGPYTDLSDVQAKPSGVGDCKLLIVDQLELVSRACLVYIIYQAGK